MFTFELVTLKGTKFGNEVFEVIIPTPEGQIAVFPNHMPLVSLVSPGVISVRRNQNERDDQMDHFATGGGVLEITDKKIRLLVDEADRSDEISAKEAQEALDKAHKLAKEAKDQVSLDHAKTMIEQQRTRLKVAELKKKRR